MDAMNGIDTAVVEFISHLIADVGFPIVVAMFVLYRMNGKLERLAISMEKLCLLLEGGRRHD